MLGRGTEREQQAAGPSGVNRPVTTRVHMAKGTVAHADATPSPLSSSQTLVSLIISFLRLIDTQFLLFYYYLIISEAEGKLRALIWVDTILKERIFFVKSVYLTSTDDVGCIYL